MYYYSTVNDIVTTHSAVIEKDGFDTIQVHFERPRNNGFDFLDLTLPGAIISKSFGFSEAPRICSVYAGIESPVPFRGNAVERLRR